jgi:predicted negative regulator of RcsB-dependent stress response
MDKNTPSKNSAKNQVMPDGLAKELEAISDRDFLQDTVLGLVETLAKHKTIVIAVIAAIAVGGIGYLANGAIKSRSELNAQNTFFPIEKSYTEKREKFDQAKFADLTGQKAEGAVKASGDLAKDYGTLVDELEAFAKAHAGTAAGAQAAMLAAETRMSYNQAELAGSTLESLVKETKSTNLMGGLVRMANGNAWAQAGKCDQAVKAWEQVLATKEISFLHGEAALRSGLCLEKSGDKTKAAEMYRKASGESERSSASQTAKALLRAIEMGT